MLMMVTDTQILSPQEVCCGCLFASLDGKPRWKSGTLGCGKLVADCQSRDPQSRDSQNSSQPDRYECAMGFRLALIS